MLKTPLRVLRPAASGFFDFWKDGTQFIVCSVILAWDLGLSCDRMIKENATPAILA